jgi:hypothetical protein
MPPETQVVLFSIEANTDKRRCQERDGSGLVKLKIGSFPAKNTSFTLFRGCFKKDKMVKIIKGCDQIPAFSLEQISALFD